MPKKIEIELENVIKLVYKLSKMNKLSDDDIAEFLNVSRRYIYNHVK